MNSEQVFIELGSREFLINFIQVGNQVEGVVYPITRWVHLTSGEKGFSFESLKSSDGITSDEPTEECRLLFQFNFCWRGVWEGRIYPKEQEYWSTELKQMYFVWKKLKKLLKKRIRQTEPEYPLD